MHRTLRTFRTRINRLTEIDVPAGAEVTRISGPGSHTGFALTYPERYPAEGDLIGIHDVTYRYVWIEADNVEEVNCAIGGTADRE